MMGEWRRRGAAVLLSLAMAVTAWSPAAALAAMPEDGAEEPAYEALADLAITVEHVCGGEDCAVEEQTIHLRKDGYSVEEYTQTTATVRLTAQQLAGYDLTFEGCACEHTMQDAQIELEKSGEAWQVKEGQKITVRCDHPLTREALPEPPKALTGTVPVNHACAGETKTSCTDAKETLSLAEAVWEAGEVTGDAENGYQCAITVKPEAVKALFAGKCDCADHTVSGNVLTAKSADGAAWTVELKSDQAVLVSCTHPAEPAIPDTGDKTDVVRNQLGDVKIRVQNGSEALEMDAVLSDYPGVFSVTQPQEGEDGWTAVLKIDVQKLLAALDAGEKLKGKAESYVLSEGQDKTVSIPLMYDAENGKWAFAKDDGGELTLALTCGEHQWSEKGETDEEKNTHTHTCTVCGEETSDTMQYVGRYTDSRYRVYDEYRCTLCGAVVSERISTLPPTFNENRQTANPYPTMSPLETQQPTWTQQPAWTQQPSRTLTPMDPFVSGAGGGVPKTGDATDVTPWAWTLGASAAALLSLIVAAKKRVKR